MATAEELLNSLGNQVKAYSGDNSIFVIDSESRTIAVPESESLFGVTGDKDVERKYFQCPKIVGDNIDLSQHQIYISYVFTTSENNTIFPTIGNGRYHCEDVKVSGDNITFSWLLSGNVLSNPGFVAFKVMAMKNEGDELKTKWNTAPAFGTVLITVPDGEKIAEEYPDIINQLFEEMETVKGIATPEAMKGYVDAYLEEHPVTGGMTEEQEQQLNQNTTDITDLKSALIDITSLDEYTDNDGIYAGNAYHWALNNAGSKHYHPWNKNWNFIGSKDKYKISAICAYINYAWTVEDPATITDAASLTIIESGGTYDGYTNLGNTDTLSPEQHEIVADKPEGANYLLVDFGYTEPQDVELNYVTGDFHIQKDGVWTESIKNEAVTGEKLSKDAVTEEKISGEAVGKEKLKTGAVDVKNLDISFRRLYMEPYIAAEGLETYMSYARAYTGDIPSNIYCIELKAGKKYMVISNTYPRNENIVADSTQGKQYVNNTVCFSSVKMEWVDGMGFLSADLGNGMVYNILRSLYSNGKVTGNETLKSSAKTYYPSMFSPAIDMYVYFGSYEPVGSQYLIPVYTGSFFFEVDEIPYFENEDDYVPTTNNQFCTAIAYQKDYSGSQKIDLKNDDLAMKIFSSEKNRMLEEALFRGSRNISDYQACVYVIGDSITYAASNAGLQNAWRKYVSTKLNLYEMYLAVSGTTLTYGYAYDFNGNAQGSDSYDLEMTGVRGIKTKLKSTQNQQNTFSKGMLEFAIVALGTNDFGNNAKLGSVETLDDDGTFYGAAYQLFHFLHDDMEIPYVIFVAPFKRENWNVKNEAEVPYTIYDLVHALAEISLLENDMYVLDCTDRWYLNYDDPAIKSKSFIDYVHITGYAHHMFTIDLAIFIQNIVAVRGLRHYQPKFIK